MNYRKLARKLNRMADTIDKYATQPVGDVGDEMASRVKEAARELERRGYTVDWKGFIPTPHDIGAAGEGPQIVMDAYKGPVQYEGIFSLEEGIWRATDPMGRDITEENL